MGQSIGRRELERRRLLAAGMVTVAGAEDGAAGLAQVKESVIRVRPFFLSILFEALIGNRSAPGQVLQLVLDAAHFGRAERITDLNL
ncbi:MAG TPA: hypothetical protein VKC82_11065 [Burkholderiales bacterium]|nr:hypothetical protein [Burkholderiales bacterium]